MATSFLGRGRYPSSIAGMTYGNTVLIYSLEVSLRWNPILRGAIKLTADTEDCHFQMGSAYYWLDPEASREAYWPQNSALENLNLKTESPSTTQVEFFFNSWAHLDSSRQPITQLNPEDSRQSGFIWPAQWKQWFPCFSSGNRFVFLPRQGIVAPQYLALISLD